MANSSSEGGRRTKTGLPQGEKNQEEADQLKKDRKAHGALHLSGYTMMIFLNFSISRHSDSFMLISLFFIISNHGFPTLRIIIQ